MENVVDNGARELAVYSDVDGTLVGQSGELNVASTQAIERFVADGLGFTLATGRSLRGVKRLLQQIPVNMPLVLCNGAHVYDPATNRSLWAPLPQPLVRALLPSLAAIPGARIYMECSDTTLWVTDPGILGEPYTQKEDLQPRLLRAVEEVFAGGEVVKMSAKLTAPALLAQAQLHVLMALLSGELAAEVSWCFSSADYLEIMRIGTSKWSGIRDSQAMRGYRDKTIVTVGDHHNDLEMIRNADIGIAMGNAVPAVKAIALDCIGDVEDGAIVHFLKDLRRHVQNIQVSGSAANGSHHGWQPSSAR